MADKERVRREVLRLRERDQDLRAGGSLRAVSGSSLKALLRERRGLERPKRESGIGTVSYVRFFGRAPWSCSAGCLTLLWARAVLRSRWRPQRKLRPP